MGNNKDIKKENNNPITIQEIENTIPDIIKDFCDLHNIEDLKKESSNIYNALLIDINKKIINPNKQLLLLPNKAYNKYNPDILYELLNIYESLCLITDNPITIYGYCLLVGIDRQTFYNMESDKIPQEYTNNITGETYKPMRASFDIVQKLRESEEVTTLNCRKYNDLRIIARLNRITGGAYRDYTQVNTGENRQTATPESIVDKYGNDGNTAYLPSSDTPQ